MNTLRGALLVGLVLFVPSHARAENTEAAKKELAALQGEWAMTSGTADGYAIPGAMLRDFKRVCKDDEVATTMGGRVVMKAKISIDPSRKPRSIDYAVTDGPTKGKKHLGIYELDGDTLKSCFAAPDAERPTDFTSKPGDGRTSSVWKRESAAPKSGQK